MITSQLSAAVPLPCDCCSSPPRVRRKFGLLSRLPHGLTYSTVPAAGYWGTNLCGDGRDCPPCVLHGFAHILSVITLNPLTIPLGFPCLHHKRHFKLSLIFADFFFKWQRAKRTNLDSLFPTMMPKNLPRLSIFMTCFWIVCFKMSLEQTRAVKRKL
jgi:hypothetical protein